MILVDKQNTNNAFIKHFLLNMIETTFQFKAHFQEVFERFKNGLLGEGEQ
ncbi:hypothetical protein M23134_07813 [Microscilla marina ATCC 23134]|uniref:Uncharacterized protein n=1 Tax=Microscilla marina ATCC 23134 TaxID=313606 RepID=A1ZLG1_MICM2|nr:hypothetical protein M23134_07813 [Microscilla marina ATCC 23134]